jgi:hypothetical protein
MQLLIYPSKINWLLKGLDIENMGSLDAKDNTMA